jgi:hypothetical protein
MRALDARFAYSQVFASSAGEHGILDLLTVTRSGRLAIVELKASEHIHLPLQVADYWLRVGLAESWKYGLRVVMRQ